MGVLHDAIVQFQKMILTVEAWYMLNAEKRTNEFKRKENHGNPLTKCTDAEDQCKLLLDKFSNSSSEFTRWEADMMFTIMLMFTR